MSSSDSHDEAPSESGPVFSREALTPRGGFMARPGLKPPPRHAVVVRGGDAPLSEHIPVARSSFPPPPPSEPMGGPVSASEKPTLREVPTPRTPRVAAVAFQQPSPVLESQTLRLGPPPVFDSVPVPGPGQATRRLESIPPPSDAPVAASVAPPASGRARGKRSSRWTILLAGVAGLVLGLASVAVTTRSAPTTTSPPAVGAALPEGAATATASATANEPQALPRASAATPVYERLPSPRPASAGAKKSIF